MRDLRVSHLSTMARRSLLASVALLAGCAPVDVLNATVPTGGVAVTRDIPYGREARQRLDVYRPDGGGVGRPVAVFLYGGGWRTGSKADYLFVAEALARRGVIVVVPDYRLYPEVRFPTFLRDCAAAVAWTLARAPALGGDSRRVSVLGHSAGAYNAAMLALDPAFLAAVGADRADLAGVAGLAGPYDFLPITDPDIVPVFATVDDGPASQPISYVDGRNPPLLLLTGDADDTVNPRNTASLALRVRAAGGRVQATLYPGLGHIGIVIAFAPLFRDRAPVLEDVLGFVERGRARRGAPGT